MATAVYTPRSPFDITASPVLALPHILNVLDQTSSKDRGAATGALIGGGIGLLVGIFVGVEVGGAAAAAGTAGAGPLGTAGGIAVGIGAGVAVCGGLTAIGAAIGGAIGTLGEDGVPTQTAAPSPGATINVPPVVIEVPVVITIPPVVIEVPPGRDGGPGDGDGGPGDGSGDGEGGDGEGGGEGGGCFVSGTLVLMADGTSKPIESIGVGDMLASRDERTGEYGPQPATKLFKHHVDATFLMKLAAGESLHTTKEHRFYTPGDGFIGAGRMGPNAHVQTFQGDEVRISGTTAVQEEATVYNLEVAQFHTYFVGQSQIWVHNQKDPRQPGPPE